MATANLMVGLRSDVERALEPPPDTSTTRWLIPPDQLQAIVEKIVIGIAGGLLSRAAGAAGSRFADWWAARKKQLADVPPRTGDAARTSQQSAAATELLADTEKRIEAELQRVGPAGIPAADITAIREDIRIALLKSDFSDAHATRISVELSQTVARRLNEQQAVQ